MEKRVCATCGIPRTKASFACHYDSHTEICHACKDFCIHRVKLAHGRGVTVHELFASEEDETRLRRYAALTKAGVVWEQVARRQHYARKRNTKRRRPSTSSASSVSSASSSRSTPVSRKRRRPSASSTTSSSSTKPRRVSCRARRKPSALSEYVDDAGSVTSHSSGDSVGSAATDAAHDTTVSAAAASAASPAARAAAGAGAVVATPSQFSHYMPTAAPVPALEVGPSAQWPMFRDFDEAVDALVGGQDLGASNVSLDEFTSVVSQMDASSPPLFDDVVGDGVGVPRLMLDVSMLDTLSSHDWDRVFMSPHVTVPQQSSAPLTVCM